MASTFSTSLRLELMATGENRSTWGTKANTDFTLIEAAIAGYASIAMANANVTLTANNGAADQARNAYLNFTGAHSAIRTVTIPAVSKIYLMRNSTTGGFDITISNGTNTVNIVNGETCFIATDATTVLKYSLSGGSAVVGNFTTLTTSSTATIGGILAVAGNNVFTNRLVGLTISNNATDAVNDIDIAAGYARDTGDVWNMILASSITKRLDAAWAVGTNQGGLDTGSIANTTYHVWLIRRTDTGVVDVLFSASATAPTMPTSYTQKRRIGSILRAGATILAFGQTGNKFLLNTALTMTVPASTGNQAMVTGVPLGINVEPIFRLQFLAGGATASTPFGVADGTNSSAYTYIIGNSIATAETEDAFVPGTWTTDTSGQLRVDRIANLGSTTRSAFLSGWYDIRGQ